MQKGEMQRTALLCIDSYDAGVPTGTVCCMAGEETQPFRSLSQLLIAMENHWNSTRFPQAFETMRVFGEPAAPEEPESGGRIGRGKLATFTVRVLFRQNASWQGSVTWLEGGRDESFRSVLELIFLMDSALQQVPA